MVRFETARGELAQVDFAHFRLPWDRRYARLVVLGYSCQVTSSFTTLGNVQSYDPVLLL